MLFLYAFTWFQSAQAACPKSVPITAIEIDREEISKNLERKPAPRTFMSGKALLINLLSELQLEGLSTDVLAASAKALKGTYIIKTDGKMEGRYSQNNLYAGLDVWFSLLRNERRFEVVKTIVHELVHATLSENKEIIQSMKKLKMVQRFAREHADGALVHLYRTAKAQRNAPVAAAARRQMVSMVHETLAEQVGHWAASYDRYAHERDEATYEKLMAQMQTKYGVYVETDKNGKMVFYSVQPSSITLNEAEAFWALKTFFPGLQGKRSDLQPSNCQ